MIELVSLSTLSEALFVELELLWLGYPNSGFANFWEECDVMFESELVLVFHAPFPESGSTRMWVVYIKLGSCIEPSLMSRWTRQAIALLSAALGTVNRS